MSFRSTSNTELSTGGFFVLIESMAAVGNERWCSQRALDAEMLKYMDDAVQGLGTQSSIYSKPLEDINVQPRGKFKEVNGCMLRKTFLGVIAKRRRTVKVNELTQHGYFIGPKAVLAFFTT